MGIIDSLLGPGLDEGTKAPEFTLLDQAGNKRSLEDAKGKWLVLYFYPKDQTKGCTAQACSFRDNWDALKNMDINLWGVSTDSVSSHEKFAEKHQLPFPVLADDKKQVSKKYNVLLPLGIANRITFLVNPNGTIKKKLKFVSWGNYAETVAKELATLIGTKS